VIETQANGEQEEAPGKRSARLIIVVRYVVPAAVVLGGLIVMALGSESDVEGGAGIVGAGLAVYAINWLYRASVDGDRERDQEEAARDYLDQHGHWPDEAPRPTPPPPPPRAPALGSRPIRRTTRRPQH
jgi:hypothetical protein